MNFSFSATVKADKRALKKLQKLLDYQRGEKFLKRRKAAWRLKKKWFNRYSKEQMIGSHHVFVGKDNSQIECVVTNVRIQKAGGNRVTYTFTSQPIKSQN